MYELANCLTARVCMNGLLSLERRDIHVWWFHGGGFALIVVLFILLIIIGASWL